MSDSLSVLLVADTVMDYLAGFFKKTSSLKCEVAPYNQVSQTLLSPASASTMLIWSSPDLQLPSFAKLLDFDAFDLSQAEQETSDFAAYVRHAAQNHSAIFLLSWTFPPDRRWPLGLANKSGWGAADVLLRLNLQLSNALADLKNVHIIDQHQLQSRFPGELHDPRMYAMARMRYSMKFLQYAAEQLWPVISATVTASRKVVICDLDDTLWGGIVGDDGMENLKIGGNDPVGEAHLQIQRELKSLKNRGILLAISSKNDSETALEAIRQHPNMLLREADFVAKRINWDNKADNIISMLDELNLLPSGAVFLDDNPVERDRVRAAIPEILVPDLPKDVAKWSGIINSLPCFEALDISQEDRKRTESYQSEGMRRESQATHLNIDDWLKSLQLSVSVQALNQSNISRVVQLINKTNQFNLHTRRLSETEFAEWAQAANRHCLAFSVADRFSDSGLTGVLTFELTESTWIVVDFVMSCRVMGKGVEDAMLAAMLDHLGRTCPVKLAYTPSAKNGPAKEFVERVAQSGEIPVTFACPGHISMQV